MRSLHSYLPKSCIAIYRNLYILIYRKRALLFTVYTKPAFIAPNSLKNVILIFGTKGYKGECFDTGNEKRILISFARLQLTVRKLALVCGQVGTEFGLDKVTKLVYIYLTKTHETRI